MLSNLRVLVLEITVFDKIPVKYDTALTFIVNDVMLFLLPPSTIHCIVRKNVPAPQYKKD